MKHRLLITVAATLAICGCVATPSQRISSAVQWQIAAQFDQNHAERLMQDGLNNIKGNGFMRQRGGGVVTCAGEAAHLIPATAYAKERIFALYATVDSGVNNSRTPTFVPDPSEYTTLTRQTKCDAQGNFTFDRVADGEFFIVTFVVWRVGSASQGGSLVQRITIKGGQTLTVIVSS